MHSILVLRSAARAENGDLRPRPRSGAKPALQRRVPAEPWAVRVFQRHPDDDPDERCPSEDFLNTECPDSVRDDLIAIIDAVAASPPPQFTGGGMWEAMHGQMSGFYEARTRGPDRRKRQASTAPQSSSSPASPSLSALPSLPLTTLASKHSATNIAVALHATPSSSARRPCPWQANLTRIADLDSADAPATSDTSLCTSPSGGTELPRPVVPPSPCSSSSTDCGPAAADVTPAETASRMTYTPPAHQSLRSRTAAARNHPEQPLPTQLHHRQWWSCHPHQVSGQV
jgi:hypothetical protein